MKWFVIGVSGATCGGKTSLCQLLYRALPWAHVINQDTYFLPNDDPRQVFVEEVGHNNWELLSALDMEAMRDDVTKLMKSEKKPQAKKIKWPNLADNVDNVELPEDVVNELKTKYADVPILLIDGLSIFNYQPVAEVCNLKYFVTLEFDECKKRRNARTYDPPDPPLYFDKVVWPMYEKLKHEVEQDVKGVIYYSGEAPLKDTIADVLKNVSAQLCQHKKES